MQTPRQLEGRLADPAGKRGEERALDHRSGGDPGRIDGDLLDGKGLGMIHLVADRGWQGPALVAENVCMAMSKDTPLETVALVGDARGGYIIWLQTRDENLFLCNANARGEVLVFAPVESPLDFPGVTEIMS